MKKILTLIILLVAVNHSQAQVTANAGADQEICLFDTVKAIGTGLPSGDTGSYQWRRISSNLVVSNTFVLKLKIISGSTEQFELKVTRIKNGVTYVDLDTFDLKINLLPTIAYKGIPTLCYSDCPYPLTNNYIAIGSAGYDPTVKDSTLRYYQRKNPSWITGGVNANDPYFISFCNFLKNNQLPTSGTRDTVCFEYRDPKGCYVNQCRPVRYNPNPVVELQDMEVCIKNAPFTLNSMVVKPFIKTGGIETYRCLSVPATSSLDKSTIITSSGSPATYVLNTGNAKDTQDVGNYVIEYCFKDAVSGCQTCDTANVNVKRYGQAYISNLPKACINGGLIELDSFVIEKFSGSKLTGNTWSCVEYAGSRDRTIPNVKLKLDSSVKNNQFYPQTGSGMYMLKCSTSPNSCAANDSIYITVNGLPVVRIDVPDTVCANDTMVLLQNITPGGKVGKWTGSGVSGWHLNASLLNISKPIDGPFKMKFTYANPFTSCVSSDSQYVLVAAKPIFQPKAVVHKIFGKYYVDFSITGGTYLDTSKQKGKWQFGNGKGSDYFTNNHVMIQDSGSYTAYFSLSNGPCTYKDSVKYRLDYKLTGTTDIHDLLLMFPNPVSDELNVRVPEDGLLTITDIRGVVVYQSSISADTSFRISTKDFAAGQYILTVSGDVSETRRLFIKQ